jgi:hypothetical protein
MTPTTNQERDEAMSGRGVFRLRDMIAPRGVEAGLANGGSARAVPEPFYYGIPMRFMAAWMVVTGRAVAVEWPQAGDLEKALNR